jgi:hypothetical protein
MEITTVYGCPWMIESTEHNSIVAAEVSSFLASRWTSERVSFARRTLFIPYNNPDAAPRVGYELARSS